MSDKHSRNPSRTDWKALEAMDDEAIDYSDIPPLMEEFFKRVTLETPATEAWEINSVLRQ